MPSYKDIPPLTPQRWLRSLVEMAAEVADKESQEKRWLAPDRHAWEHPDELVNQLFDDGQIDLFLEQHSSLLNDEQRFTAIAFRNTFGEYADSTPAFEDPSTVLADPKWEGVRRKAAAFVAACRRASLSGLRSDC